MSRNLYPDCLSSVYDQDSVWNVDPRLRSRRVRPLCFRRLERSLVSASVNLCLDSQEPTERIAARQIAENYERWMK